MLVFGKILLTYYMNDPLVRIQELLGYVTLISYIIFGGDMVIA